MRKVLALFALGATPFLHAQVTTPSFQGCPVFPANSVWNTRIDQLPVDPNSNQYVAELGASLTAHPDFGAAYWNGYPNGFPVNIVHGNSIPAAQVYAQWTDTSDPGPYPIPSNVVIGPPPDNHLIVFDVDNCMLYEAYETTENGDGSLSVDAISKFDLRSNQAKPPYWSSSNAAGTPQFPLLVRYDEAASGHINHAISMTGSPTGNWYVWPATHYASSTSAAPAMGTRFRLKASFNTSNFSPINRAILEAMKTYGVILTDNGASWHLQGVPDPRWDDTDLHALTQVPASAFEAVDESSLMSSAGSDAANTAVPAGWVNIINRYSGKCLDVTGGPGITWADTQPGDGLQQWDCNGGLSQLFQLLPISGAWTNGTAQWLSSNGGGYEIVNAASGQAITIPWATSQMGVQMVIWAYTPATSEVWLAQPTGDGYYYFQSLMDGEVLDNRLQTGWANGSIVQQWSYWYAANQQWAIVPVK